MGVLNREIMTNHVTDWLGGFGMLIAMVIPNLDNIFGQTNNLIGILAGAGGLVLLFYAIWKARLDVKLKQKQLNDGEIRNQKYKES